MFPFESVVVNESAVPKSTTMFAPWQRDHAATALHRRSVPISCIAVSGTCTGSLSYSAGEMTMGFFPHTWVSTVTYGPIKSGTTELSIDESNFFSLMPASRKSVSSIDVYSSPVRFVSVATRHSLMIVSLSKTATTMFVFPMSTASSIVFFLLIYYYIVMETLIQPKVLKGFRDFLPNQEILRSDLIEKLTHTYRSYGFVPIDTPVLEYTEILLRKSNGETEKQVFRFEDNGGRDVAMRFDLTVPFARFTAEHKDELYFPFKRYHLAKVWRGEKPQAGRYREFVQCDFDTVGSDSAAADFEILNVMRTALAAIGVKNVTIRMNHRGIFNRFLAKLSVLDRSEDVLRSVDKLAKVGREEVVKELTEITGNSDTAAKIIDYISEGSDFDSTLARLEQMAGGPAEDTQRMKDIYAMMKAAGIESSYVLDPSITRGLDYYTGVVYETFLNDRPSIGSVCSGGRYDNLAGLYMKEKVPGVGASIGLDRLIAGLEQLGLTAKKGSYLDAEIYCLDAQDAIAYQKTAAELRAEGIAVEVFPDAKKIAQQYAVTEAKGVPWGVFVKEDDVKNGTLSLKNLATREITDGLTPAQAADRIKKDRSAV